MLKFQLENLDGVDSSLHSFYEQTDTGYRLKVEGIDDGKELKNALQKEREIAKANEQKAKDLQKMIDDAQNATLAEQGKFKDLFEKTNAEKLETQKQLADLTRQVAERQGAIMVKEVSTSLTSDPVEQKIIEKFALDMIVIEGGEAKWSKTDAEIKAELSQFVRSKASGTGDKGNKGGDGKGEITASRSEFDAMSHPDRAKFLKAGGKILG